MPSPRRAGSSTSGIAAPSSAPAPGRRGRRLATALAVVWIAALHLALAWIEHRPGPRRMWGDEYTYLRWAVEIDAGGAWRPDPPLWPPLYPHFVAPLLAAGGRGAVAAAQLALLVAAALALRGIGRALSGPGPAPDLAAAALLGFPPLAAHVHYLSPEVLHLALMLAAAWIAVSGRRGWGWLAALGLTLGLAAVTKHLLAPLVPLLLAALALESGRRGLARGFGRAAVAAAACAAVIVPVHAADRARHGQSTAADAALFNLWAGLEARSAVEGADLRVEEAYRAYRAAAPDQRGRREFVLEAIDRRLDESGLPALLSAQLGRQYFRLLDREGLLAGQLPGGSIAARGAGYLDPPRWLAAALRGAGDLGWAAILALAPFGLALAPPWRGPRWRWLPAVFVAYNLALFLVLHVTTRYRVQLLPFLVLWAAVAAAWSWRRAAGAAPGEIEPAPRRGALAGALAVSALLLVLAFGAGGGEVLPAGGAVRAAGAAPLDVLLVTFDAADSSALVRLAARGARFTRAFAAAPCGAAAVASMHTGRYPSGHGVGCDGGGGALPPGIATLAEALAAAGYDTAAVAGGGGAVRRLGLDRGFAVLLDGDGDRDAPATPAAARALLAELREPWFVWLHVESPGSREGSESWLEALAAAAPPERTLVIVTAVHGRPEGEAGSWFSADPSIAPGRVRVPLILAGPAIPAGGVIETPVSTAAVLPAVLEAAGLRPPRLAPAVPSLLPLAARLRSNAPPAFVESATRIGVARGDAYLHRARGGDAGSIEAVPLAGTLVPVAVRRDLGEILDASERRAGSGAGLP